MSKKHPIISVTGSSGAGTTTVKHTFQQIFRREGVTAVTIEGDAFHRYDRAEMKKAIAAEEARGNNHLSHFSPEANVLDELENTFRAYSETGTGKSRHYVHDHEEELALGSPAGTFTPWKDLDPGSDLLFYEGLHGAVVTGKRERGPTCRPQDRRRAGHQSRMDSENSSRPCDTRLYDGGGHADNPAPHARLCAVYLPAVHGNRHQLPARADGRHVESVHRALDPDARRIHGGHPLQGPARHRLPLSELHDPRQLHEPRPIPSSSPAGSSIWPCSSS